MAWPHFGRMASIGLCSIEQSTSRSIVSAELVLSQATFCYTDFDIEEWLSIALGSCVIFVTWLLHFDRTQTTWQSRAPWAGTLEFGTGQARLALHRIQERREEGVFATYPVFSCWTGGLALTVFSDTSETIRHVSFRDVSLFLPNDLTRPVVGGRHRAVALYKDEFELFYTRYIVNNLYKLS